MGTGTINDTIIEALRRDLDEGFTTLVRTHQAGIFSGAYRLTRSRTEAEDVAQETMLRAYRSLAGFDDERIEDLRIRPWLWTIALNLVRTRSKKPRESIEAAEWMHPPTHDQEPIDDDAWNERLGRLNGPQRTAVVLRHVLDLPITEIAEITGRPEGTVKADISRGLGSLRATMEREALL